MSAQGQPRFVVVMDGRHYLMKLSRGGPGWTDRPLQALHYQDERDVRRDLLAVLDLLPDPDQHKMSAAVRNRA
jgi:hypothetical protein